MAEPAKRGQRKRFIRKRIERNQKRVQAILLASKARIDSAIVSAARNSRFATSAKLRDTLYRDIAGIYEEMGGDINDWATKMTTATAKEWHKFGISDLPVGERNQTFEQFSRKHMDDYFSFVHPQNISKLAVTATTNLATQDIRFIRRQVLETLREASVTGMTTREIRKEMQAKVTAGRPDWKFIDSAGRKWKPDNYFNMLARTSTATVAREAYNDTVIDQGHDLAVISGGVPTAPPPDPCWEWFGKVVSLTGATRGYPTLAEAEASGLFHPNCIHYTAVVLDDEVEEFKAKEEQIDAERVERGKAAIEDDPELGEQAKANRVEKLEKAA